MLLRKFASREVHKCLRRSFSSALFITGDKAQSNFAVLTPVVDFDDQMKYLHELEQNINARQLPIQIDKVVRLWEFYKSIDLRKNILEETKSEIGKLISKLLKEPDKNTSDIEKLKLHLKIVKDDLRMVKSSFYNMEEEAMLKVLSLPNVLHLRTPKSTDIVFHDYLETNNKESENHMAIGATNGYIKFLSPMFCYLKSDAALFEIAIQNYIQKYLNRTLNYMQFSNSNFVRSVVVEGCGIDSAKVLTLEDPHEKESYSVNKLHLEGASSLCSFMAYFTKHLVQPNCLPLKLFSIARKYQNVDQKTSSDLFSLNQSTAVNIFIASEEHTDLLDEVTKEVTALYESLGHHFRMVFLSAPKLDKAESLRLSIQMYSNSLGSYIEVGNVSVYESYLSKRLLFNYSVNKERKYPKVIAGSLLNVHKLLACILENNSVNNRPLMCDLMREHIFVAK